MVLSFEDTPLFDWLKKNRFFLLGLVVMVVGLQGYQYFAPGLRMAKQTEAWSLFDTISSNLAQDFDANLAPDLAQAQENPIIYPWVLFAATNTALIDGNEAAVSTLKPKLEAFAADASQSQRWKTLPAAGEPTAIAALLLSRVEDFQARKIRSWENPEPQGARIKIVIKSSTGTSYDLIAGLYEAQTPLASAAFLDAVDQGLLVGKEVKLAGSSLSFSGYAPDSESSLPLERVYGLFHLAGALSSSAVPGKPGQQKPGTATVHLQNGNGFDGSTTVFGSIVEGLEDLQAAAATPDPEASYTIAEAVAL